MNHPIYVKWLSLGRDEIPEPSERVLEMFSIPKKAEDHCGIRICRKV